MSNRFEYPFQENYQTIDGIRIHYIDEGEGQVIWLMHGNTTWSYLYRKMIPILVDAGYRCIAPDLMGFGLSDKPKEESVHTLQKHVELMSKLITKLNLKNIIPVGQDWGGPISLRYAIENKENIRALVILNTFIQRFPKDHKERKEKNIITGPLPFIFPLLFKGGAYSKFLIKHLDFFRKFVWLKWKTGNPSIMLGSGFRRPVDPRAMAQYLDIHKNPVDRAGLVAFPKLIPNHKDHPNADYIDKIGEELSTWEIPTLVIWSDGDLAWKPDEGALIAQHVTNGEFYLVRNAGHFLQEDAGEEVAERMVEFLQKQQV